jgi:hypothetical protein
VSAANQGAFDVAITRCERGEDVADDEDGHQAHEGRAGGEADAERGERRRAEYDPDGVGRDEQPDRRDGDPRPSAIWGSMPITTSSVVPMPNAPGIPRRRAEPPPGRRDQGLSSTFTAPSFFSRKFA